MKTANLNKKNFERLTQCSRLLEALYIRSLTTIQVREELSILHPAGRVKDLRKQGFNIITHGSIDFDSNNRPHRVARYVLFSDKSRRKYDE